MTNKDRVLACEPSAYALESFVGLGYTILIANEPYPKRMRIWRPTEEEAWSASWEEFQEKALEILAS